MIDYFDVIIDFIVFVSILVNIELCKKYGKKLVIGMIGFFEVEKVIIELVV